jgi:hypothetical protein
MRTTFNPAFKKTKRFGYPNRFFVSLYFLAEKDGGAKAERKRRGA